MIVSSVHCKFWSAREYHNDITVILRRKELPVGSPQFLEFQEFPSASGFALACNECRETSALRPIVGRVGRVFMRPTGWQSRRGSIRSSANMISVRLTATRRGARVNPRVAFRI